MKKYSIIDNLVSALIAVAIIIPIGCLMYKEQNPETIVKYERKYIVIPVHEMTEEELEEELFYDSLELLTALVHAEAGNQDLIGKRLVADVVLNRVDHPGFPNTVEGVIFQSGQFSPTTNGALDKAYDELTEEDYEAVRLALEHRLDSEILWFNCGTYLPYGERAYQHGDHYFSKEAKE